MSWEEEAQVVIEGLCQGSPPGPALATQLRLAVTDVLRRHGVRGARVLAKVEGRGVVLDVLLAADTPRVRRVSLGVGFR